MATLTRQEIIEALHELARLSETAGLQIELIVVGGALMALAYNARNATKDVDVLIISPEERATVRKLAEQVADTKNLPDDWLNDAVKGFFVGISVGETLLDLPGLRVKAPAVEQVLAMKLCAWRQDVDIEDADCLLRQLISSNLDKQKIWKLIELFLIPGMELRAKYAFDDLWELQDDGN